MVVVVSMMVVATMMRMRHELRKATCVSCRMVDRLVMILPSEFLEKNKVSSTVAPPDADDIESFRLDKWPVSSRRQVRQVSCGEHTLVVLEDDAKSTATASALTLTTLTTGDRVRMQQQRAAGTRAPRKPVRLQAAAS
eukprot:9409-Rhodomonas_salina.2